MKVVVVGGTVFAGPHVVRTLLTHGHEVLVYHRGEHEAPWPASLAPRLDYRQHWVVDTTRLRDELAYTEPVGRSEGVHRAVQRELHR